MTALLHEDEGRAPQHCAWCGTPTINLVVAVKAKIVGGVVKEAAHHAWCCTSCEARLAPVDELAVVRCRRAAKAMKENQETLW